MASELITPGKKLKVRLRIMKEILIYSSDYCPFCHRAKSLLDGKGLQYKEIVVDGNPALRQEMALKAGRTSVPQVWIGDTHVGGSDELYALERAGSLDSLINQET